MSAGAQISWDEQAPQIKWDEEQKQQPEQPGFFARASERLLGTQHPIDQAVSEATQLYHHPASTLGQAALQAGHMLAIDMPNALLHPVQATGGPEFAQDMANKNYRGAAGTLAGDIAPILMASPELRDAAASVPEKVSNAVQAIPDAAANTLRTEKGTLRPGVRSISRAGGAAAGTWIGGAPGGVAGALAGPSLVDALVPDRDPSLDQLTDKAVKEGRAARLPTRMPKTAGVEASPAPAPSPNVQFVKQFEKPPERTNPFGLPSTVPEASSAPNAGGEAWSMKRGSSPELQKAAAAGDPGALSVWRRLHPNDPQPIVIPREVSDYPAPREVIRFPQEPEPTTLGASVETPSNVPELRNLSEQVRRTNPELAQHLSDLADGKIAPEALKAYVKSQVTDARTASEINAAIDTLAEEEGSTAEAQQAPNRSRPAVRSARPATETPELGKQTLGSMVRPKNK